MSERMGMLRRWWVLMLLGLVVLVEISAAIAQRCLFPQVPPDIYQGEVSCSAADVREGMPKILVLGSSPAMVERSRNRPFPKLLKARLEPSFDVVYFHMGWADSAVLEQETRIVTGCGWDLRYVVVYAGHQDYNRAYTLASRQPYVDSVLRPSARDRFVFAVLKRSHAARLLALLAVELRYRRSAGAHKPSFREVQASLDRDAVLSRYRENLRKILACASGAGAQTLLVTLALDERRLPGQEGFYRRKNEELRRLAREYPGARVVDFQAELAKRDFSGRADCEPYESHPDTGECWDSYHLGMLGHEVLAGMIERVIGSPS